MLDHKITSFTAEKTLNLNRIADISQQFEASFLEEFLKNCGHSQLSESFSGGVGEEGFRSFLRAEHAKLIVKKGGIGLSQSIHQSLINQKDHTNVS